MAANNETIQKVIAKWRTFPGCKEGEADPATLGTEGHAYRMLKTCAMLNGCTPEEVVEYLIDKAG